VRPDIEHNGTVVISRVCVVGDDPLERLPVDRIVGVREEDVPGPVVEGVRGLRPDPSTNLCAEQVEAGADEYPSPEEDARKSAW